MNKNINRLFIILTILVVGIIYIFAFKPKQREEIKSILSFGLEDTEGQVVDQEYLKKNII